MVAIVRLSHLGPTRCRALLRLLFGLADLDRGPEILPPEPPDVRNPTLAACNLQRANLAKWVKFNKNDRVNEHCLAIPKAPSYCLPHLHCP